MAKTVRQAERKNSTELHSESSLAEMVTLSLARVEELSAEEADRQLSQLIICANRIKLSDFIKAEAVDELIVSVPVIEDLIEKIHDTAQYILTEETFDGESSLVVKDLGVAADITQDKELLEKTIHALEDTSDLHIESLKQALIIAHSREQLFGDIYKNMKSGRQTYESAMSYIPVNERVSYPAEDEYAFLSTRRSNSKKAPQGVAMSGYDDLYDSASRRTTAYNGQTFEFTGGPDSHITQVLGRIASDELKRL